MRILLLASAFNGLTQRISRELTVLRHTVSINLAIDARSMEDAVARFEPELIICPFLKVRIPDSIWQTRVCLIVHPGIEGDRGPSSLDWAIMNHNRTWGVTVLQAAAEMDGGEIWGTSQFELREAAKASTYRREITEHATRLVLQAVKDFTNPQFKPRRLDYRSPQVTGRWNRPMRQDDRKIDWSSDTTDVILSKFNAAESAPGVLDCIGKFDFHVFGATRAIGFRGRPGELIARHHGSVCRATVDGAVWLSHLRPVVKDGKSIKLPAMQWLESLGKSHSRLKIVDTDPLNSAALGCNEIRYREHGDAGYLHFDFYNGAMSTEQCQRLRRALVRVKQRAVKIVVLMGGDEFWSNGIHLNRIEAAPKPADEAWQNINAIDDVVREILDTDKQLTVAALRNNAGAGGAVMAAACDYVLIRGGVVLNLHYQTMGLYGSEYWTYVLPRRVGAANARQLVGDCLPTLAVEAHEMGLANLLLPESWPEYHVELEKVCQGLTSSAQWKKRMDTKRKERARDESLRPLHAYRDDELGRMRACFFNPKSDFHRLRQEFVMKRPPTATPQRLTESKNSGVANNAAPIRQAVGV